MAYKMVDRKYCACLDDYKCEFVVDADADFANLPQSAPSSTAVSLESGKVMVVNTQGKWVEFGG